MTFYDELWRRVCVPPDRRPIWQWAEEHIKSIPYSPNPGAFRVANSPQIKAVFEAITDPRVRVVSIIAAVQAAKTLVSEISLAYIIANMPGPTLWLNETDEDAKDQSESRLQKLFDVCQPVRDLYPANRHKRRNTTIHFSNGTFVLSYTIRLGTPPKNSNALTCPSQNVSVHSRSNACTKNTSL